MRYISDNISCSPDNSISSRASTTNNPSLQQLHGGNYSSSIHNKLLVTRLSTEKGNISKDQYKQSASKIAATRQFHFQQRLKLHNFSIHNSINHSWRRVTWIAAISARAIAQSFSNLCSQDLGTSPPTSKDHGDSKYLTNAGIAPFSTMISTFSSI